VAHHPAIVAALIIAVAAPANTASLADDPQVVLSSSGG
jgi:hypothetical protein